MLIPFFAAGSLLLLAQPPTAPVVSPRGVVNAYSLVPAPSQVSPGGIIWINGFNLGPVEGAKATELPLPLELAGVQVTINNRRAPIFSVSPNRIEAQVPLEVPQGTATVIVRRGSDSSRPARINIVQLAPALRSAGDSGYGEAAVTKRDGNTLTLAATGLGGTDPRLETGAAPPDGATLVNSVRAYVGGLAAASTAAPSATRPGEFDITITVPEGAAAGDLMNLAAGPGGVAATPRRLYQAATQPEVKFLPVSGNPDIRALAGSDLRGPFAMAAGPRADTGCYPAYRIDFNAMKFDASSTCVTAGNRNQPNPFVAAIEGNAIAALAGPPEGELPNGVSSKVAIFSPGSADVTTVELPALALNVASQNGNFRANLQNAPAVLINADTQEVSEAPAGAGGGGGGGLPGAGGAGGGGGNAGCLNPNLTIDLGDGLNKIISCTQAGQGLVAVIVDNEDAPKKAKLATLTPQGQVQNSFDFPAGYLPMVLPALQVQVPPGGGPGGGGGGVVGGLLNRLRAVTIPDGQVVYVVVRAADGNRDALAAFANQQVTAIPFPDGWFAASCTPNLRIFNLDLARQIGFPATKTAETTAKQNCPAYGFVLLDRDARQVSISESPGSQGFNAASQAGDLADFIYTVSTNPQRVNVAESLYVLDSTTGSSFRLDLPPGVAGFGQVREELALFSILAPANATPNGNGDAGIAVFDLDSATAKLLPTPEGFAAVQILGIFDSTRKVVARGTRTGNTGSSILIYDLVSGDLFIPNVPPSCTFAGVLPGAAPGQGGGGGGQQQQAVNLTNLNPKANAVVAGCFDANRRLTGFLYIRSN
jgi:uncharacterized protein (TIGR03437 family)